MSFQVSIVILAKPDQNQVILSQANNAESIWRTFIHQVPHVQTLCVEAEDVPTVDCKAVDCKVESDFNLKTIYPWILSRLQAEDYTATLANILINPEEVLQQIKETKRLDGQWIALLLDQKPEVLLARIKITGILSYEYSLEPRQLIRFHPFEKTTKKEYIHSIKDKEPRHLRERILSSLLWCQEEPENATYQLDTHEGFYQVTEKTLATLHDIQNWVETSIRDGSTTEDLLSWQLKLRNKLHFQWGPLDFPTDPEKDEGRYQFEEE